MIVRRPAQERGHANHGWLDTYHTFSFGSYHDADHMGFRALRVINDDIIQGGQGFGTHGHRNMEIISYLVDGALEHKDSMGNGSVLRPGDVQRMTAGRGIKHSEFNPLPDQDCRLLQIWIEPERPGLEPGWEEKHFAASGKRNQFQLLVSPDGSAGSMKIHQDVRLYATILEEGNTASLDLENGRFAWVQVVKGRVDLGEIALHHGDGAAVTGESAVTLRAHHESEVLVFDLA